MTQWPEARPGFPTTSAQPVPEGQHPRHAPAHRLQEDLLGSDSGGRGESTRGREEGETHKAARPRALWAGLGQEGGSQIVQESPDPRDQVMAQG